jgi:hypothetical protein
MKVISAETLITFGTLSLTRFITCFKTIITEDMKTFIKNSVFSLRFTRGTR